MTNELAATFQLIPIPQIHAQDNPRTTFDEEALLNLAVSIKQYGILEPLVVMQEAADYYVLVAGERRLRAAKMAGLVEVPVIVRDFTAEEAAVLRLTENLQRQDLDPIDEARALETLVTRHGVRPKELAKQLGMSEAHVSNRRRLLRLPESVLGEISRENLSASVALALVNIADGYPDTAAEIAAYLVQEKVTQVHAQEHIARWLGWKRPTVRHPHDEDEDGHENCPCRRKIDRGGYGGECIVCLDPKRYEAREAERREQLEQEIREKNNADEGVPVVTYRDVSTYQPGARYRRVDSTAKADHSGCVCRREGILDGHACALCTDPAAFNRKEMAATKAANKAAKEQLRSEQEKVSQEAVALSGLPQIAIEGDGLQFEILDLAYIAAQIVTHIDPSYDQSGKERISKLDYLRRLGLKSEGGVNRQTEATLAQELMELPARDLWRICLEWPFLALGIHDGSRDFQWRIHDWYRRQHGYGVIVAEETDEDEAEELQEEEGIRDPVEADMP